ncbi:MAG: uroporphyrinogen decarboxylase family protein [Candidatus Jordarchaeum sp.]|uniref:uroporphyrinogen decarboxylase family protein n=1 Tax=Candidatus Jordarchaeum sp. TaxID=2823881 RepID=UPI00404AFB2D
MSHFERMFSAIVDEPVDRLPAFPMVCGLSRRLVGATHREYSTDAKVAANSLLAAQKKFDMDVIPLLIDLSVTAGDFGAKVRFPEENTPMVEEFLIKSVEDYEKLEAPEIPGERMKHQIETTKLIMEKIAGQVPFSILVEGPLLVLTQLAGTERVLKDIKREPKAVNRALELITEALVEYLECYPDGGGVGAICMDFLWGNRSIMSDDDYRKLEGKYEPKIRKKILEKGYMYNIHNCGESPMLDIQIREYQCPFYSLATYSDRGENRSISKIVKEYSNDALIVGSLDTQLFTFGTVEMVQKATRNFMEEVAKALKESGHRSKFVISTGCEISPSIETKLDNVTAMMEIVNKYGPKIQEKLNK